jgi:hypothetical protein
MNENTTHVFPPWIEDQVVVGGVNWNDLVMPDLLMPSQYAGMHTAANLSPEGRLWWAVIEDAAKCLSDKPTTLTGAGKNVKERNVSSARYRLRREALRWFEDQTDVVGSFVFCCGLLNLDADSLRDRLLKRYAAGEIKVQRKSPTMSALGKLAVTDDIAGRQRKRAERRWRRDTRLAGAR